MCPKCSVQAMSNEDANPASNSGFYNTRATLMPHNYAQTCYHRRAANKDSIMSHGARKSIESNTVASTGGYRIDPYGRTAMRRTSTTRKCSIRVKACDAKVSLVALPSKMPSGGTKSTLAIER